MKIDDILTSPTQVIDLAHGGRTLISKSDLYDQLKYLYGDREFYVRGSNPSAEFKAMLTGWWSRRGYHFARLFDAFEIDYNPIENTDRYESITDTTTGNGTNESGTHSTTTATDNSTQKSNAYNVSDSAIGKNSNTSNADASMTASNVSSSNQVYEHDAHIHGNIGTMTAAQLLQGEKQVRFMDLTIEMIQEFVDIYSSY